MTASPMNRLAKPGLHTPFHIDFDWWEREGRELRVDVVKHIQPEFQAELDNQAGLPSIDVIDPETAEVASVDPLQHALSRYCKPLDEFLTEHTSLVDAVFHVFLSNGNQPLTPEQLEQTINRPAATIVRMVAGRMVYKGLRPVYED